MHSTIPWRYSITYTDTTFECEDIPHIIRTEKNNQDGRSIPRIEKRILELEHKLRGHHLAVTKAFQKVPELVNQIKGLHRLGLQKEDANDKSKAKQLENATTRNDAKKKIAQKQAEFTAWKAQQMNDDEENLGPAGGSQDIADAEDEDHANAEDDEEDEEDEGLTNEEDAELLYLEKCLRKRASVPINRTLQRLQLRRTQFTQMKEAMRSPDAVLAQQLKKDADVKSLNRALKKETKEAEEKKDEPIPDRVEQLISDSVPIDDNEMNQAVQREAKEATERKRKADAEEKLKRAEAHLRLAKLAKAKANSVPESPRSLFGIPIPPLPSWGPRG